MGGPWHVYPTTLAAVVECVDPGEDSVPVRAPEPDCALCQVGGCMQLLDYDGLVLHTWVRH